MKLKIVLVALFFVTAAHAGQRDEEAIGNKFAAFHLQIESLIPMVQACTYHETVSTNLNNLLIIFGGNDPRTKNLWNNQKNPLLGTAEVTYGLAKAKAVQYSKKCPLSVDRTYENAYLNATINRMNIRKFDSELNQR